MMKTPLMKCIAKISWAITGLYSFNELLKHVGFDFMSLEFIRNNPAVMNALSWLIGLAGLASLIFFALVCSCKDKCCGDKSWNKDNGSNSGSGYCSRCGSAPCRCPK
jgi:hypothetical protein